MIEGTNIAIIFQSLIIRDPVNAKHLFCYPVSPDLCNVMVGLHEDGRIVHCDKFISDAVTFAKNYDGDIDQFNAIDAMMGKRIDHAARQMHSVEYTICDCYKCDYVNGKAITYSDGEVMMLGRKLMVDDPKAQISAHRIATSFWSHLNTPLGYTKSANNL